MEHKNNDMKVELTREDLTNLVKGSDPNYSVMDHPMVKTNGSYTGGHHDKWDWNYSFDDSLTEQQLWELYVLCRDSWK